MALTNFTPKGSEQKHFPLKAATANCSVPAGGTAAIKLVVAAAGPQGKTGVFVYTYDVEVNGRAIEPEIVIGSF